MPILHSLKSKLALSAIKGMGFERRIPKQYAGPGAVSQVGKAAKELGISHPLVVTDHMLVEIGLVNGCLDTLKAEGLEYELYDKVTPDPTTTQVVDGAKFYTEKGCDGLIAFGGGSSMDCAKVIGLYVKNPISVEEYKVPGSTKKGIPPLICIPTTAGTGSETTPGAVIRNEAEESKFTVIGVEIIAKVAILDPNLLCGLPKPITAATGMDAMTHAVESYVGSWARPESMKYSENAVVKLCQFLKRAYDNGEDMEARTEVLKAAFDAGIAISMAGIGYVHAIAHTVGGKFHTPHGVANAMIMPKVLDFYVEGEGPKSIAVERLANLAVLVGLGEKVKIEFVLEFIQGERNKESNVTLAKRFITKLREMNSSMNMPQAVKGMKSNDVSSIADKALKEAHGSQYTPLWNPLKWFLDVGYPLPKYLTQADCEKIVSSLLEQNAGMRASL